MDAELWRWCYGPDRTQGILIAGDLRLHTIERPWVAGYPGGKPYESCIPEGKYDLLPFVRSNGDECHCLVSPSLHVYEHQSDVPASGGRFACLIHSGNWVKDVVGCIAPGLQQVIDQNRTPMVTSSRTAIRKLMEAIPIGDVNTLTIRYFSTTNGARP